MSEPVSRRVGAFFEASATVIRFLTQSTAAQRLNDPTVCNFVVGNPQEMPIPAFADALQRWSVPQNKDWFAYKMSEPQSRATIAKTLLEWRKVAFKSEDIFLTNGAFAALAVTLTALTDPGDEVIFISPPWFFYEGLIAGLGGVPVRVKVNLTTFDLDLAAIARAITPKTRAIIVNSPNNPTGKIYPPETLQGLGDILTAASKRNGRTIYLLSDEAYSRIVYDDRAFYSPTSYYPESFLLYTYGKTLLTPGQRIGYIALPPTMPNPDPLRNAIMAAQLINGYSFPNALLQHALPDLERMSIDIPHLQVKRDRMVTALREMGYEVHVPEGTFYLLPRSPIEDDVAFLDMLAEHDVLCLPGAVAEAPGFFRISLTANDDMIDRALPGFKAAREKALRAEKAAAK